MVEFCNGINHKFEKEIKSKRELEDADLSAGKSGSSKSESAPSPWLGDKRIYNGHFFSSLQIIRYESDLGKGA